jgi:molecular chaperone Hsp33
LADSILRGIIGGNAMRFFVACTRDAVNEANEIHKTTPVAAAALGRLLTASAMMGCMMKNDSDLLTLMIRGDGPIGGIVATSDSNCRIKGYAYQPDAVLPLKPNGKLDVSGAIGAGTLSVIKDTGLKEPYFSQIELISGEIAEDLTHYFATSEQTPSSVALGVLVDRNRTIKQAGGFILQSLPTASAEAIDEAEKNILSMPPITSLLSSGSSQEDIIRLIAGKLNYEITDSLPVSYWCNCSRNRVEKALASLGAKGVTDIMREDGQAEMHCHFCGKNYHFSINDLESLLCDIKQ